MTRWALYAAVPLLVAAAVSLAFVLRSSGSPPASTVVPVSTDAAATWAAGEKRAPDFTLHDEHGRPVSLAALRGRPVLITFIDQLCRDFCPREASVLTEAAAKLGPQAPAIVSVSVNPWADTRANFAVDALHWQLAPGWRWGTGSCSSQTCAARTR